MKRKGTHLLNGDTSVPDAKLSPNHPNNLETMADIHNNSRGRNKHKDKDTGNMVPVLSLPGDQQPPEAKGARSQ